MYILVHGKYGPTTQHAFFSALRVQCVWFTLSDSPIRTVTYSEPYVCMLDRWGAHYDSTTESFLHAPPSPGIFST